MTADGRQNPLAGKVCPRCGRELVPLEQLADLAGCAAVLAHRVRDGLASMRLVIPQKVSNAVRELATATAPRLAQGLACAAGACSPLSADATGTGPLLSGPPALHTSAISIPGPKEGPDHDD